MGMSGTRFAERGIKSAVFNIRKIVGAPLISVKTVCYPNVMSMVKI